MLGASTVVFVITQVTSDPAALLTPVNAPRDEYLRIRAELGLDEPFLIQFVDFLRRIFTFDLGESFWQHRPVGAIILERLPFTLTLAGLTMLVTGLAAIVIGFVAGFRPGSRLDRALAALTFVGVSVPSFWVGLSLIAIVAVQLQALPTSGSGDASHLVLPVLTLALRPIGRVSQVMRSAMQEELGKGYVLAAQAKGIRPSSIVIRHMFRNASIPVVTMYGLEAAEVFAGATVVVETVFAYPGVGYLLKQAIDRGDWPIIQAVVVYATVVVVLANLLVDLLYTWLDPRLGRAGRQTAPLR